MNKVRVICLLAIAPVCAFAIDGQILINQSTVTAAGGFPYVISNPGSYKLTGNLSATAGKSAIQITTSNVTLDLNGFNLASLGPSSGAFSDTATGILIIGNVSNIAIHNGSMLGFSPGITMLTGTLLLVEDMSFEENFSLPGITIANGIAVEAFNGARSLLKRVITDGQLLVSCPSLISDSVANFIKGFGAGVCVFANTVGN